MLNGLDERIAGAAGAQQAEVADVGQQSAQVVTSIQRLFSLLNVPIHLPKYRSQGALRASARKIRAAAEPLGLQQNVGVTNAIQSAFSIILPSHRSRLL